MDTTTNINKSKLSSSVKTLTAIEAMINTKNFAENFNQIEKLYKEINFVHADCLDYKEQLNTIYDDLAYIKKRINYLAESLRETLNSIEDVDDISSNDLVKLSKVYEKTNSSKRLLAEANKFGGNIGTVAKEITKIPPVEQPQESGSGEINTVPIGIAIGATGIIGSAGAVIINEINTPKSKPQSKQKRQEPEHKERKIKDDYRLPNQKIEPARTPYHASRSIRQSEIYYGDNIVDELDELK